MVQNTRLNAFQKTGLAGILALGLAGCSNDAPDKHAYWDGTPQGFDSVTVGYTTKLPQNSFELTIRDDSGNFLSTSGIHREGLIPRKLQYFASDDSTQIPETSPLGDLSPRDINTIIKYAHNNAE